jgi:type IV secretory pathway component VirB8
MPSYEVFKAEQISNFIFLLKFYILAIAFIAIIILTIYVVLKQLNIFWLKIRSTRAYHKFYRSLMKGAKQ